MSDTKANLQKWSDAWEKASVTIQEEWSARLTAPDYHANTMAQFADMFDYAVENSTPSNTSGLIEMQKYFMKLRPKAPSYLSTAIEKGLRNGSGGPMQNRGLEFPEVGA